MNVLPNEVYSRLLAHFLFSQKSTRMPTGTVIKALCHPKNLVYKYVLSSIFNDYSSLKFRGSEILPDQEGITKTVDAEGATLHSKVKVNFC